MGIAFAFGVVLIALAITVVVLWGAFEALVRCGRLLWWLIVEPRDGTKNTGIPRKVERSLSAMK